VHDWSEAWFNDLASPVKAEFPEYRKAEKKAAKFIYKVMNVCPEDLRAFDEYDKRIYCNERNCVFEKIGERGMGDDRSGLPQARKWMFAEQDWRTSRINLWKDFMEHFPEWFHKAGGMYHEFDPFS
jgi:hypothetical protein